MPKIFFEKMKIRTIILKKSIFRPAPSFFFYNKKIVLDSLKHVIICDSAQLLDFKNFHFKKNRFKNHLKFCKSIVLILILDKKTRLKII